MLNQVKHFFLVIVGVLWICLSLNIFLLPHQIASAGVGSIGYLLENLLTIDRNIIVFLINSIMLFLAFIFLERKIFFNTVIGSLVFPVILWIMPEFMLLASYKASLVIGSLFFSFGIFSLYSIGASNGGVTIPPLIFEKYFNLNKAVGVFLTNMAIILLNLLVFGIREAIVSGISICLITLFINAFYSVPTTIGALKRKKSIE